MISRAKEAYLRNNAVHTSTPHLWPLLYSSPSTGGGGNLGEASYCVYGKGRAGDATGFRVKLCQVRLTHTLQGGLQEIIPRCRGDALLQVIAGQWKKIKVVSANLIEQGAVVLLFAHFRSPGVWVRSPRLGSPIADKKIHQ